MNTNPHYWIGLFDDGRIEVEEFPFRIGGRKMVSMDRLLLVAASLCGHPASPKRLPVHDCVDYWHVYQGRTTDGQG